MKRLRPILFSVFILCGSAMEHANIAAASPQASSEASSAAELARTMFVEGVPYERANQYGPDAVPELAAMLNNPEEAPHWARAAMILGVIGDESAVNALIAFLNQSAETLSPDQFRGKTSALASLGYAVNKTGSRQALDYLAAHLDPATWSGTSLGTSPFHRSEAQRNVHLSTTAAMGLGLSGNAEAAELLRGSGQTESAQAFRAQASDAIAEALRINEQVSERGLAGYYQTASP